MWVPALLLLVLPALLSPASTADPDQPCPSEMNKVKDILEVNCTAQGLSAVPHGLPKNTGILLLSTNRLKSLSIEAFVPFTQLQDLDLSHNGLVALNTGALLPSLKELILSHNALVALPELQGLPGLTRLAVAHNSLATLAPGAFHDVSQLRELDLQGNQLRTLPWEVFAGLSQLKDLDISDNLLEELPKELLQDLHNLETLWLSGNRLRTLPTDFFPEGHIFMYVFLTDNPWHCDCNLRYLRFWILENEDSVYQPERGLEKTKVEVAPEKVVCQTPAMYQWKPIIHFKLSCGSMGDADEEEEDEYGDEKETMRKLTTIAYPPHSFTPKERIAMSRAVPWLPLPTTGSPLNTPCTSTLTPSTSFATPTNTRAPIITTPAPASPTVTPTETPSTTRILTAAPTSTLHRLTTLVSTTSLPNAMSTRAPIITTPAPASPTVTPTETPSTTRILTAAPTSTLHRLTTLVSTTSLPNAMSTRPPSTSGHSQTTLATSTTNTYATLMVSTGTFPTNFMAMPSTAVLETSSTVNASSSPLTPTMPVVSTTMVSTHAPTPPAPLATTHFTQPASSPPPVPLCPCSSPGLVVPMLCSQVGGEHPQWGQWVLRHCCLLHWVLYLASLALLLLTMLALAGWLVWMRLVGRSSWRKPLQIQEVQYPLMERRESMESPAMHLSSFKSPLRRPTFCTIKEIELCPEVTYCTIKDLGIQRNPPTSSSFCTTKELWVHHSPPNASFSPISSTLKVTNLGSQKTPSAYSLDRGVKAIGDVSVKYAGNTL